MSKKELDPGRPIHRVDLSLPVVQTDSYEIFYTVPSQPNSRTTLPRKPLVENQRRNIEQASRLRTASRLKQLLGPVFVNVFVDTTTMTAESVSSMGDNISNPLVNSTYSTRTPKALPNIHKAQKQKPTKDDCNRSRSSSDDRLLYESFGSFDTTHNVQKAKTNNMWQNIHHPQLSSSKALHFRSSSKRSLASNDAQLKTPNTKSYDNLSHESAASTNEQLYDRIERFTKTYFPVIQTIRHSYRYPEFINDRSHLHRDESRDFMPILSRSRAVR